MNKTPILILSGWRVPGNRYNKLQHILEESGYKVFSPDLPGFGEEKLTKPIMTINDYQEFVTDYIKKNKIENPVIIAHSFGGRVVTKMASTNPSLLQKLILTGTPLIKEKFSLKKRFLIFLSKKIKIAVGNKGRKLLYFLLGEWDYYNAPENLRETFKSVIAEDNSQYLSKIHIPTLVIWGEKDKFVSSQIGKEIALKIPQAIYVEVSGATHKLPYEYPELFAKEVLSFIQ